MTQVIQVSVLEGSLLTLAIDPNTAGAGLINPTITWSTSDGTATANKDYVASSGSAFNIQVQTIDDQLAGEPNEVFFINATITGSAGGVVVSVPVQYVVTIQETLSVNSGSPQTILPGQVVNGGTVNSGGVLTVDAGGTVSGIQNNDGVDWISAARLPRWLVISANSLFSRVAAPAAPWSTAAARSSPMPTRQRPR